LFPRVRLKERFLIQTPQLSPYLKSGVIGPWQYLIFKSAFHFKHSNFQLSPYLNSGDSWYLANSSSQCSSVNGGRSPTGGGEKHRHQKHTPISITRALEQTLQTPEPQDSEHEPPKPEQIETLSPNQTITDRTSANTVHIVHAVKLCMPVTAHLSVCGTQLCECALVHNRLVHASCDTHTHTHAHTHTHTCELPVRHREARSREACDASQHDHRVNPHSRAPHPPHQLATQVCRYPCV
jgi:hypothetical protein